MRAEEHAVDCKKVLLINLSVILCSLRGGKGTSVGKIYIY